MRGKDDFFSVVLLSLVSDRIYIFGKTRGFAAPHYLLNIPHYTICCDTKCKCGGDDESNTGKYQF
jgi:hypothetical protein